MNKLNITITGKEKGRYISALLILHGINQSELAKKIGVSQPLMSAIARGTRKGVKKKGQRVREAVAEALGMKVENLWPDNNKRGGAR